jgi:membrane protein implicated in regulation of membrane protease activity
MSWWAWGLLGLLLLAVEMGTAGGLFALFFGMGALAVAALSAIGLSELGQWIAFPLLSLAGIAGLRRTLSDRLAPRQRMAQEIVGEEAVLLEDVAAGAVGKAELRGVPWNVKAWDGAALRAGQRTRVERVEGLTLYLRADEGAPGEGKWNWSMRRW